MYRIVTWSYNCSLMIISWLKLCPRGVMVKAPYIQPCRQMIIDNIFLIAILKNAIEQLKFCHDYNQTFINESNFGIK